MINYCFLSIPIILIIILTIICYKSLTANLSKKTSIEQFSEDKIHLISYGDEKYKKTKEILSNEAHSTKWFSSINLYGQNDLTESFTKEFSDVLKHGRGGGHWIWKYDIILKRLAEINYGDFLIYIDSGCKINSNGGKRLKEYIDIIKKNKHKIISFELTHIEKIWTTKQIFNAFNVSINGNIANSNQYVGGIMIMQKCNKIIELFEDCLNKIRKDHLIITDHYNVNQNSYFKDNRHDQSISSVARKIHGSIVIPDETYGENLENKPFLAIRRRG
jgi:hypothetical protein